MHAPALHRSLHSEQRTLPPQGIAAAPKPLFQEILCAFHAGVLGGERTLQLLTEPLAAMSNGSSAAFDWRTAEAALYCVRAIHR